MARKLKKITLQYRFLNLELEDIDDEVGTYTEDWLSRFGKYFVQDEIEMWEDQDTGELRDKPPSEDKPVKEDKPAKIKKAYRKLSTHIHPDKGGSAEEFSRLKKAYDDSNLLELASIASEHNIEIAIDEEDINLLEKTINKLENSIKKKRMSLIYQFYNGDKKTKEGVLQQLEIMSGQKIPKEVLED